MSTPLSQRLYLRIWFAVIAAVTVLTILFTWLWRWEAEHERSQRPGREIVVRNDSGEVIGHVVAPFGRVPGQAMEFAVPTTDGKTLYVQLPRPIRPPGMSAVPWWRPPFDFVWLLALVALAVSLGTYPIVRRLTKRLEALQEGVDRWGQGDLSHRLPEEGRDEVAFLAQRFNVAAERVQALLAAHKALLANASHELRSPLARIRMGLELMGDIAPTASMTDEIARNIRELDQLIDEILLASRLDASPIDIGTLEPVDLVGLCAEECALANAELDVQTGRPNLMVQGVAKLLHRVVRNLLENARRYAAGEVTLILQQADPHAVIRVRDHGPGVPPDLRARIFEPFYRLPGASERHGGVGLGLALVKSITERHGGTVRCEEAPGGGACFIVELPGMP
jgi:two-component system, OmpR family, sensor kinase